MTTHAPSGHDAGHAPGIDGGHDHPHVNYMLIFGALCVLTLLSVLADVIGGANFVKSLMGGMRAKILVGLLVLTIASFKASFVMLYFMHLKFEGRWKYILLAPTMILALAIVVALVPDIGVHYYDVQVPQTMESHGDAAHGDAAHGGEAHGETPHEGPAEAEGHAAPAAPKS